MRLNRNLIAALLGTVLAVGAAGSAMADPWNYDQPRRTEVNDRLDNQDQRINQDHRDGSIDHRQARRLHREDRRIRRQERREARRQGGHIGWGQQARLNHEENGTSRQIYGDAH